MQALLRSLGSLKAQLISAGILLNEECKTTGGGGTKRGRVCVKESESRQQCKSRSQAECG